MGSAIREVMELTHAQWDRVRHHFPEENIPDGRPGRKPVPTRRVLEAVLWVLNTGAQWNRLPQCYPNYKTVHRRFSHWVKEDILRKIMQDLANELRGLGLLDTTECFIDATFAPAKRGGEDVGLTKKGKGTKIMAIVDAQGLPLAVSTHAANHHEVTLVQLTLDFYMIEAKPERLIGDKAYDSDALDESLGRQDIQMIAPHRSNRNPEHITQDGRSLRRYARRWVVEKFFAGLQFCRRLVVRYECVAAHYLAFVQLASIGILLKQF
jgi:transposase